MNIYFILFLRFVHIFAGALWVGSAILYFFYVEPTVKNLGPAGGKFMFEFVEKRRYPIFMTVVSLLTIMSGIPLYWMISGGFKLNWMKSGPGLGFTIGSILPLIAFLMGILLLTPRGKRMGELGMEIGESGGTPTPEQTDEMQKLEKEFAQFERIEFIILSISLIAMATARYWYF